MNVSDYTAHDLTLVSWTWISKPDALTSAVTTLNPHPNQPSAKTTFDPLHPVRQWLDSVKIQDSAFARFICRLIPAQCPFERDIKLFGRTVLHIPPLCKLNPVYEQVVGLRFRALCYLADECGEDVTPYC